MELIETIVCYVKWAVGMTKKIIVEAFDFVLSVFISAVNLAFSFLPELVLDKPSVDDSLISTMAYFVPIVPLFAQFVALVGIWAVYRAYRFVIHRVTG